MKLSCDSVASRNGEGTSHERRRRMIVVANVARVISGTRTPEYRGTGKVVQDPTDPIIVIFAFGNHDGIRLANASQLGKTLGVALIQFEMEHIIQPKILQRTRWRRRLAQILVHLF